MRILACESIPPTYRVLGTAYPHPPRKQLRLGVASSGATGTGVKPVYLSGNTFFVLAGPESTFRMAIDELVLRITYFVLMSPPRVSFWETFKHFMIQIVFWCPSQKFYVEATEGRYYVEPWGDGTFVIAYSLPDTYMAKPLNIKSSELMPIFKWESLGSHYTDGWVPIYLVPDNVTWTRYVYMYF